MGIFSRIRSRLRRRKLQRVSPQAVFTSYFHRNKWRDPDSRSGKGSNLRSTAELREFLPPLIRELGVRSMVDLPCGDFFWMAHVGLEGIDYVGGDIVPELIEANRLRHERPGRRFEVIDLIEGPVPRADLLFVRDCLVHLSNEHVLRALANIRASGSVWLLTTVYPSIGMNEDIVTGEWRALDLRKPPFNLPDPERLIPEGAENERGQHPDKHLGLWRVATIPMSSVTRNHVSPR